VALTDGKYFLGQVGVPGIKVLYIFYNSISATVLSPFLSPLNINSSFDKK
jgi:hypothetical protein